MADTIEWERRNCPRISEERFYNFNASMFITNPSASSAFFLCSFDLFAVHEGEFAAAWAHFVTKLLSKFKFINNCQIWD